MTAKYFLIANVEIVGKVIELRRMSNALQLKEEDHLFGTKSFHLLHFIIFQFSFSIFLSSIQNPNQRIDGKLIYFYIF